MKNRKIFFLLAIVTLILDFSLSNNYDVLANDDVEEKNKKINDLKSKEDKAVYEVSLLQKELDQLESKAKDLAEENTRLTVEVVDLDHKTQDLNIRIAKRKKNMNMQVRSIQLHNSLSIIKTLIDSESLTDLLMRCVAIACFLQASHSILDDQFNDVEEVQKKSMESFKRMQQLQMNQVELEISKKVGEQKQADLQIAQVNLAIERTTEEGVRDTLLIQKAEAKAYAETVAKRQQEEAEHLKKAQQESQAQIIILENKDEEIQSLPLPQSIPQILQENKEKKDTTISSNSDAFKKGGITSGEYMNWSVDHGFYWGQCTWYVNKIFDYKIPHGWGNAATWSSAARVDGRNVSDIPRANSIACYQPGCEGASVFGHVAVVTSVNKDGTYNISESNVEGLGVTSERRELKPKAGVEFIYM
ncbi:MAG: CHAP domain-containing protein [Streptococcaceae bacterium]|jgi:peptidoglycan hydrolase CwlO-like protein|nr:CHAP domain-containing protein [Streptococcaceae bacterium]